LRIDLLKFQVGFFNYSINLKNFSGMKNTKIIKKKIINHQLAHIRSQHLNIVI